jgi:hypothetical protein
MVAESQQGPEAISLSHAADSHQSLPALAASPVEPVSAAPSGPAATPVLHVPVEAAIPTENMCDTDDAQILLQVLCPSCGRATSIDYVTQCMRCKA